MVTFAYIHWQVHIIGLKNTMAVIRFSSENKAKLSGRVQCLQL